MNSIPKFADQPDEGSRPAGFLVRDFQCIATQGPRTKAIRREMRQGAVLRDLTCTPRNGKAAGALRDQLPSALGYYVISEPAGVSLVVARSAIHARDFYFDAVKDEIRGDPENPEPYTFNEIHVRTATYEDLRSFRAMRVVPPRIPRKPAILGELIDRPANTPRVRTGSAARQSFHRAQEHLGPRFRDVRILLIPIMLLFLVAGCATSRGGRAAEDIATVVLAGAGGYAASGGRAEATGAAAVAGLTVKKIAEIQRDRKEDRRVRDAYDLGQLQATKSLHQAIANTQATDVGEEAPDRPLLPLTVPERTIDGVIVNPTVEYVRLPR